MYLPRVPQVNIKRVSFQLMFNQISGDDNLKSFH